MTMDCRELIAQSKRDAEMANKLKRKNAFQIQNDFLRTCHWNKNSKEFSKKERCTLSMPFVIEK